MDGKNTTLLVEKEGTTIAASSVVALQMGEEEPVVAECMPEEECPPALGAAHLLLQDLSHLSCCRYMWGNGSAARRWDPSQGSGGQSTGVGRGKKERESERRGGREGKKQRQGNGMGSA